MNWGTKIVIGMGIFMLFIAGMVFSMISHSGGDSLIEKDYYEKGLNYDEKYQQQTDALNDEVIPEITARKDALVITFKQPAEFNLSCKRLSDAKADRSFAGRTESGNMIVVPASELLPGPWRIYLQFNINGKNYQVEREVIMP